MVRLVIVLLFLGLVLSGCGNSVRSFEGSIDKIEANGFLVNCSNAANKGKTGAIDAIGYICNVQYNNQTIFRDKSGTTLNPNDFSPSSIVNITLEKPVDIRRGFEKKKPFVLNAKEIVLITKEDS